MEEKKVGMEETPRDNQDQIEEIRTGGRKDALYKPGEKGFAVFLLLLGAYFVYESLKLYRESPGASSYGAVPLFVSSLIVIFSFLILITDWKKKTENSGRSFGDMVKHTLAYMFPVDVVVIFVLIILYCVALQMGVGFEISTSVFLWVGMSYLMRTGYLKNILWTALCMAFILLVFSFAFSVVLP